MNRNKLEEKIKDIKTLYLLRDSGERHYCGAG